MILTIVIIAFFLLLALTFLILFLSCRVKYYCTTGKRLFYASLGGIFLISSLGVGIYYFSKPPMENVNEIFKPFGSSIDEGLLKGKGIDIVLPKSLEKDPTLSEEIKSALCRAIKEKLNLRRLECKFYSQGLDSFITLTLRCNFLGICKGFVIFVNYRSEEKNRETLLGRVEFRL